MSPTTTCLVSIVLAGAASGATLTSRPAYPIPPRPLRMLVEEADFIVTADVKAAGPEVPRENRLFPETKEKVASATIPNGPPPDAVVLHVDQVLKGDPGTRTIAQTNYRMICPEPAKYVVGTRVLAFLDRAEGGRFTTHALSYGAKTLGDAESEKVYVERVKEQQRILVQLSKVRYAGPAGHRPQSHL